MLAIRSATPADVALLLQMIREFAEFERELDQVEITTEDLLRDGFGPEPRFHALLADWDGEPAAYAVYFVIYSTWAGRPLLFLEDLYVRPQFRSKKIGKTLLQYLAGVAREQNCYGMRWEVIDWNTPAIEFYRSIGAQIGATDRLPVLFTGRTFQEFGSERKAG